MALQAIQNSWREIEPYIVPAAVTAGVTFMVHRVWGDVAALCFASSTFGFALGFPAIVKELTKDDLLFGMVRIVVSVALPFFGPQGVVLSAVFSLGSFLLRDVRLYMVRQQLSQANSKLAELTKKAEERAKGRQKMVDDCNALNKKTEETLQAIPPTDDVVNRAVQAFEQKITETENFLVKVITGAHLEDREQLARRMINEIENLKKQLPSL